MKKLLLSAAVFGSMIAGGGGGAFGAQMLVFCCPEPENIEDAQKKHPNEVTFVYEDKNLKTFFKITQNNGTPPRELIRATARAYTGHKFEIYCEYNNGINAILYEEKCQSGYGN